MNSPEHDMQWASECVDCGNYLNAIEEYYYGARCERCEQRWTARMTAWRHGGDDDELDEAFSI